MRLLILTLLTFGFTSHAEVARCPDSLEVDFAILDLDATRDLKINESLFRFLQRSNLPTDQRDWAVREMYSNLLIVYERYVRFRALHPGDFSCSLSVLNYDSDRPLRSSAIDGIIANLKAMFEGRKNGHGAKPGVST